MNSFIPWVGGKSKLLWIINKMAPDHYSRFIDVFGGSGTVTMSRPIQPGCMEVYNDFNSNLTNLFCCVKNRPLALLAELGFLPLNTRDDFNVLYKFLSKGEITDDYLQEEMELTENLLKPPEAEAIRTLLLERAPRGDVRRAADFFKLVRYSFSGSSKSFGGRPCDIRRLFHLIWECSRRLANVIVENKDFEDVIRQYDRSDAWIYCDPPYFEAECYEVAFSFGEEIIESDGKLNFYLQADFDVDAAFGTFVCTDQNDDWLNIYANYDVERDRLCDTLELNLCKGDGSEECWSYPLNAAEQEVLLRKMETFCQQQTGMSLHEYAQQLRDSESQTPGMQM